MNEILQELDVPNISSLSLRVDSVNDLSVVSNFAKYNIVSMELFFNSSSFIIPPNYFTVFNHTLVDLLLTGHPTANVKTQIDDFDVDAFRGLARLKSISLQYLKCEMNRLSMMKSGSRHPLVNIERLSFRHIDMVDDILQAGFFSPLVGLTHILLENQNVDFRNVNLTSLASLEQLELIHAAPGTPLPSDLIQNKPKLKLLRLVGFQNPEIRWDKIFAKGCPANLQKLYVEMGQLRQVELKNCHQLELMSLSGNALKTFSIAGFSKLTELSLSLNQLENIQISGETILEKIDLSHNPDLAVASVNSVINNSPALVSLALNNLGFGQMLPNFDTICPTGSLSMNMCNIREIPIHYFNNCKDLKYLSLDGNEHIKFTDKSLAGLISIARIDCLYCNKRAGIYLTKVGTKSVSYLPDAEITVQSFADAGMMISKIPHVTKLIENETEETTGPFTTPTIATTSIDWSELDFDHETTTGAENTTKQIDATTDGTIIASSHNSPTASSSPAITAEDVTGKASVLAGDTTIGGRIATTAAEDATNGEKLPTTAADDAISTAANDFSTVEKDDVEKPPIPTVIQNRDYFIFEGFLILFALFAIVGIMVRLLYRTLSHQQIMRSAAGDDGFDILSTEKIIESTSQ